MTQTIFFATGNAHKLQEIDQIIGKKFILKSFRDIDQPLEVEETESTLEGNAALKARAWFGLVKFPCFADDTGLEVTHLNGQPGVHTARYAGPSCDAEQNMAKLLRELEGVSDRSACFRTVIAFYDGNEISYFPGELRGHIARAKKGDQGFGYDPIFIPEGETRTLAELGAEAKNKISHRAIATLRFAAFLNEYE